MYIETSATAAYETAMNPTVKRQYVSPRWVDAAKNGDIDLLETLNQVNEWSFGSTDRHGATAEQWCAGSNQLHALKYCIIKRYETCKSHCALIPFETEHQGFDPNTCTCEKLLKTRRDGRNALHWACRNGHFEIAIFLLFKCCFNVNAATFDGTTCLMYAVFGCHLELAKELVKYGAVPEEKSNWGCDLAHWIAISDCKDTSRVSSMCDWLFDELNLEFSQIQKEGRTPLHKAAYKNNIAVICWFLGPMDSSFIHENLKLPIFILKQCIAPDAANKCPSDLALKAGHLESAKFLRSVEASIIQLDISNARKIPDLNTPT